MRHPEWAGYLACFQAYVDARARGDREHARQAKILMGYFAEELLGERGFDPEALLDQLGLKDE